MGIHADSAHDLLSDADLARHLQDHHGVHPGDAARSVHPSRLAEQLHRADYDGDLYLARLAAYHEDAHYTDELREAEDKRVRDLAARHLAEAIAHDTNNGEY